MLGALVAPSTSWNGQGRAHWDMEFNDIHSLAGLVCVPLAPRGRYVHGDLWLDAGASASPEEL